MGLRDLIEEEGISATLKEIDNIVEADLKKIDRTDEAGRLLARAVEDELGLLQKVRLKNNFDMLHGQVLKIGV